MAIFQKEAIFSVECQESVSRVIIFKSAVMSVCRVGGRFHRDSEGGLTNMKQATSVQRSGLSGEGRVGGDLNIITVRTN